jgi:flagellar biosynthesis/type III secretory pathway protein FliH
MKNFRDLKEMSDFIKDIRMNNLDNRNMNQKLYEIEQFILNSEEDYSICSDYDDEDLEEKYEEGYEDGNSDGYKEGFKEGRNEIINEIKKH